MTRQTRRRLVSGLLFTSPFLVGFSAFTVYPVFASLYYSFCSYNVFSPPEFNWGANYRELFFDDPLFWKSLYNTFVFTIFAVPLTMLVALGLAMLLNLKVRGLAFYRTVFFLPAIVPVVASSVLWLWVLNPKYGIINEGIRWINHLLEPAGYQLPLPGWLSDPVWVKPALVIMSIWGVGHTMILYLAGLQEVPQELYEAAEIDGASAWRKTWHVTLPMISPVLFFTLIMGLIGSFQYFTQVWVMLSGGGGPKDSALFYALYLFNNAFTYFRMGYASAMAWILFLIIMVCTYLTFRTGRGWVHYAGA